MRFSILPPPRRLASDVAQEATSSYPGAASEEMQPRAVKASEGDAGAAVAHPAGMPRPVLTAGQATDFPRRHLFDPEKGWFRRTERAVNKFLCRRVYPRVPGMERPYDWILDRSLTIPTCDIRLKGLGGEQEGIRALLVSDVHAGPFVSAGALHRTFERLMSLAPDLVLVAGDFATVSLEEIEPALPAFRRLRAPLGVFGVLGNHDHYTGKPRELCRLLARHGIRPLQNRSVVVHWNGARLHLAGVDDLLEGDARLEEALTGRPSDAPSVLLSHNPDVFPDAVRQGVSLVLAGHTHGGQIRVPGLGVLVRMSRFRLDEGRFLAGGSQLVVSRGLGVTGLPLRLFCPPEAILLTLRPA